MKLYDIISNMKFVGIKHYKEMDIDALTCSSNDKMRSSIYFCLKGHKFDGHNFARTAIDNGAVCLVVEKYLDIDITQILVENARSAMSYISSVFFETYKSKMKFIGITGTNGKTTSTYIIRDLLSKMGKKVGLIGTEGIHINSLMLPPMLTTPDPINLHKIISDMTRNGCEFCVMEVSAHAIALNKIDNICYDVVGLSNITQDHLDFFINMDNYVTSKASLFSNSHAKKGIVNSDCKYSKEVTKNANLDIMTYGKNGNLKLVAINKLSKGSEFVVEFENKQYVGKTNLIGNYNVYNILLSLSCLMCFGFNIKDLLDTLSETNIVVPGRLNLLDTNSNFKVVVDYAHTPDGIENVLKAVKNLEPNRIITVFGCGGNRDKTKRKTMGEIACKLSDYVVITSDNPRDENPNMIIEDIRAGVKSDNYVAMLDRKSAIIHALSVAKQNDIVMILGKGAESYQEIKGVKYPFSDYSVVDEYFENLKKENVL